MRERNKSKPAECPHCGADIKLTPNGKVPKHREDTDRFCQFHGVRIDNYKNMEGLY